MNMKLSLLAASLVALGGCVAPGYDYVQPDYAGSGGYYSGGYYDGTGGYYSDYYDGCCDPASVSIGFGYGYGYPGYYDWGSYPYGYYGGYYDYDYYHHHHGDWDDHHSDHGGYDPRVDPAVQRWPNEQPSRVPDHPRVPHWNTMTQSSGQVPQPQISAPRFTPHYQTHSHPEPSAHEPPRSWTPPRHEKPKAQQF